MKVSNENLVLHLPFDEESGSSRAYNFAPNRTTSNDGVLSGNCWFNEDLGCVHFDDGDAEISVNANLIDYANPFTCTLFIRSKSGQISLTMNYHGTTLSHTHTADVSPNSWYFCVIQRVLVESTYYTRFFVNDSLVLNEPAIGTPCGFEIRDNDDDPSVDIDDLKVWQRALSISEIFSLCRGEDDVEYYVDGVNFKTFGVEVSQSEGLLDALERKEPLKVDWDGYHGEVIDLHRPHYQPREISLECFIVASDNYQFVKAMDKFFKAFEKSGTARLTCEYTSNAKPLEYDVYRNDKVEVEKTWNDDLMVGTFTIALREPQPVKRVLKFICQEANQWAEFTVSTYKRLSVSWGDNDMSCKVSKDNGSTWSDNDRSQGISGTAVKVKHQYASAGSYNIVIHGNIEDIESFTSDLIPLWSKL